MQELTEDPVRVVEDLHANAKEVSLELPHHGIARVKFAPLQNRRSA